MTYDLDFAHPVPAEQPTALLETIKMYLQGGGSDPYARHRATLERRAQATAAILSRLHWPLKGWFQRLLRWAHDTMPAAKTVWPTWAWPTRSSAATSTSWAGAWPLAAPFPMPRRSTGWKKPKCKS